MHFFKLFLIQSFFCLNLFSNFLDQKLPDVTLISKEVYEDLPSRENEDIVLNAQKFGKVKFAISYPKNLTNDDNILLILDGLETGRDSLKYVPHPKNYILIGYEFEKDLHRLRKKTAIFYAPKIRKAVLDVPFQLLSIVKWTKKQSWGNKNIIIIGASFGAIFVPATYHLAEMNNIKLSDAVMAFGGAGLYDIFYANLRNYKLLRKPLAFLASKIFNPIDPIHHLPHIHGRFLIINGTQDENIPLKSAERLQKLTPEPKTVINIDTKHLDPNRQDIINEVVEISLKWLKKNQ